MAIYSGVLSGDPGSVYDLGDTNLSLKGLGKCRERRTEVGGAQRKDPHIFERGRFLGECTDILSLVSHTAQ